MTVPYHASFEVIFQPWVYQSEALETLQNLRRNSQDECQEMYLEDIGYKEELQCVYIRIHASIVVKEVLMNFDSVHKVERV